MRSWARFAKHRPQKRGADVMKSEGYVTDKNRTGRLRAKSLVVVVIFLLLVLASAAKTHKALPAKPPPTAASEHASKDEEPELNDEATAPSEVIVEGRRILTVYQPIGTYTPKDRAERIAERIVVVARDGKVSPDSIGVQPREAWTEITANDKVLMAVTDVDAKMAKKTRDQLAAEDAESIRQ